MYFREVDLIDVKDINWKIRFDRNNQTYKMLVGICYLTINGLLQSTSKGEAKLMNFLDDQRMSRLYEKFVLNYYIREHPEIRASSSQIKWQLDDGNEFMLPKMQSDVYLEYENKVLIIDTKYYSHTTQQYWGVNTVHSGNLYQIFTYVKNTTEELKGKDYLVSGMLLYARTTESIQPDNEYMMSGNRISVKTLDLNRDFSEIRTQLDAIVNENLIGD
jgi:5-methylcytosine-specific restriction enzyme subunit McrC